MIENATSIHHSAVELVDRLSAEGLVRRQGSRVDRRQVRITLTARGLGFLERLSAAHKDELHRIAPSLRQILDELSTAES
jgi:DNA-binding MarR family transcriptional regulator